MSLTLENPLQPVLEIPPDLAQWDNISISGDAATQWRIYLHQLAAPAILQWCQDADEPQSINRSPAQLWPNANPLDIWHVVDGLAITLGERRVVVMISEAMDAGELRVPQEWIDLPAWAGDYYVAAYVDVDEGQLALWGYTPYAQLKQQGQYDVSDRTYVLEEDALIQDFSAFWVAQQLESLGTIAIESMPTVSPTQLNNLIPRLANALEPRLELPFGLWGALMSNPDARSRLYQQRQGKTGIQTALANTPTQLAEWTTQRLSEGWNSLTSLLPQSLAYSVRSSSTGADSTASTTTGAKEVVLQTTADTIALVLAISVTTEADERRNIRIRLYPNQDDDRAVNTQHQNLSNLLTDEPLQEEPLLPEGVTLTLLLTESEQQLQTVSSGERDNYIQLPPFRCPAGEAFSVRVQYAERIKQEDFVS